MVKKANVVIRTEERLDDDVEDDIAEEFVKHLWGVRFNSLGYEHDYEIRVESIEEEIRQGVPPMEEDEKLVLEALVENPGSYLQDIHQALAADEEITRFQRAGACATPGPEACWNEEHREIQNLLDELDSLGLAEVDGRGKPWYPTTEGEKIVSGEISR